MYLRRFLLTMFLNIIFFQSLNSSMAETSEVPKVDDNRLIKYELNKSVGHLDIPDYILNALCEYIKRGFFSKIEQIYCKDYIPKQLMLENATHLQDLAIVFFFFFIFMVFFWRDVKKNRPESFSNEMSLIILIYFLIFSVFSFITSMTFRSLALRENCYYFLTDTGFMVRNERKNLVFFSYNTIQEVIVRKIDNSSYKKDFFIQILYIDGSSIVYKKSSFTSNKEAMKFVSHLKEKIKKNENTSNVCLDKTTNLFEA